MSGLVQVGNAGLREVCKALSVAEISHKKTQQLMDRLYKKLKSISGVGLAAPQVGVNKRLFVVSIEPTKYRPNVERVAAYAVINPEIVSASHTEDSEYEGCFSVAHADLFAKVIRPSEINVRYYNEHGEQVERSISGLEARVFLHEYDHLNGKVFLDTKVDFSTFMSANEYKAMRAEQLAN